MARPLPESWAARLTPALRYDRSNLRYHRQSWCQGVTCAIMCQAGKGYSLWLCKSHEQEHPDVTANCDD